MEFLFLIIILIFSVIIHEVSHGAIADYLGDPTARLAGRLTLNPLKHLDLIGSFLVPFFLILMNSPILFAWAKPVPINPRNFRDQKYGSAKAALAGPLANLGIALFFGLLIRFFPKIESISGLHFIFGYIVFLNILLAVFNLLPIPPLDGSHILFAILPNSFRNVKIILSQFGLFILLFILFTCSRWLMTFISLIFEAITGSPFLSVGI